MRAVYASPLRQRRTCCALGHSGTSFYYFMNFTYVLLLTVDFEFVAGVFTLNDVTLLVIVLDFS